MIAFTSGQVVTDMKTIINFGTPLNINGTKYESPRDRALEQSQYALDF